MKTMADALRSRTGHATANRANVAFLSARHDEEFGEVSRAAALPTEEKSVHPDARVAVNTIELEGDAPVEVGGGNLIRHSIPA